MKESFLQTPLKIDRRPLWRVVADRTRRYQIFGALVLLSAALLHLSPPEGLSTAGYRALVLFGSIIFLWTTGFLPLAVTSLFALGVLPLLGIMEAKKTYALFGNEAVFFILGAFILAAAMTGTGLSSRLARTMLARFGTTPRTLALTVFLLSALLSFCMSEHAVAAMMFPVVMEIANSLGLQRGSSRYGKLLFLSIAWGCVIGGIATFLGGARAPMAVGMLRESTGLDFTFMEWTAAAIMIVVPLLLVGFLLLLRLFPQDIADVAEGHRYMMRKRLEAGRISHEEIIVAAVTALTIVGWVFFGKELGLANIAILAVVLLFLFRVVSWEKIEEYVNWGVILMYGGAIAVGTALEMTGAAEWLTGRFLGGLADSPVLVVTLVSLVSLLLTACISNAAVIAILMPVGLSFAKETGLDPRIMTLAIALPSGLDFCLPMGTPVNAIAFSSGFLKSREMMASGAMIAVIAWGFFLLSAFFIWPLIGLGF